MEDLLQAIDDLKYQHDKLMNNIRTLSSQGVQTDKLSKQFIQDQVSFNNKTITILRKINNNIANVLDSVAPPPAPAPAPPQQPAFLAPQPQYQAPPALAQLPQYREEYGGKKKTRKTKSTSTW